MAINKDSDFISLDDLALSLVIGGNGADDVLDQDSGEKDRAGKPMTCGQVFEAGHCSPTCTQGAKKILDGMREKK